MSQARLAVLGAVGVALLLLGVGALRGSSGADERGGVRLATEPVGSGAAAGPGDVVVHVAGAVDEPGVYRLPAGARVADAVKRAGGASPDAAPDGLNLAARLADGQQVAVPARRGPGAAGAVGPTGDGPISLGSAESADLEEIDGIGPITAEKIIEFRDQRGGVAAIEELDAIPGIGPATLESLADRLQP